MAKYELDGVQPTVAESAWIADSAQVIGRVEMAADSSVWFGAVLRGDNDPIRIGVGSNIQDGSVLHTDKGKPLGLFKEYYRDEELTRQAWHDGIYHTGDVAWRDEDGYYWFEGRIDDVIKSSGYRIGPFEVESALMTHPAVIECAITGVPDEIRGQVVKATIVLSKDYKNRAGEELVVNRIAAIQTQLQRPGLPDDEQRQLRSALLEYTEVMNRSRRLAVRRSALEATLISMPDKMEEVYQLVITSPYSTDMGSKLEESLSRLRIAEEVAAEFDDVPTLSAQLLELPPLKAANATAAAGGKAARRSAGSLKA